MTVLNAEKISIDSYRVVLLSDTEPAQKPLTANELNVGEGSLAPGSLLFTAGMAKKFMLNEDSNTWTEIN